MKTSWFWCIPLALLDVSVSGSERLELQITADQAGHIQVSWPAVAGEVYAIETTTNLALPWQRLQGEQPLLTATTNTLCLVTEASDVTRFYRVAFLDTHAPAIVRTDPIPGAIAVSRQTQVRVWLEDASGVDPKIDHPAIGPECPADAGGSPVDLHEQCPRLYAAHGGDAG